MHLVCCGCGNGFESENFHKKYCTKKCQKKQENKRRSIRRAWTGSCRHCKKEISGRKRRFCNRECQQEHGYQKRTSDWQGRCHLCNKKISGHKRRWCDAVCRENARDRLKHECTCQACGKVFKSNKLNREHCSKKCRTMMAAGECRNCGDLFVRVIFNLGTAIPGYCCRYCKNAHGVRNRQHWRRAGRVGKVTKINLAEIYKRDGGKCQICNKAVSMKAKKQSLKPSIDHITPLSKGGKHDWFNVQLAHYGCNSRKHNNTGGQMRLFG